MIATKAKEEEEPSSAPTPGACSAPFPGGNEAADDRSDDAIKKISDRPSADGARESSDERLRRKADSGGEPPVPPIDADAARTRFEARLRRKADSGGKPALSPADAAREGFESRLRRKADAGSGGRHTPQQPLSSSAAAAAASNIDNIPVNRGREAAANRGVVVDGGKEALELDARSNPVTDLEGKCTINNTKPNVQVDYDYERGANPRAGDDILDLREWRESFHDALKDLHHLEEEHGHLSVPASHPRVVRVIRSISVLDGHMRSSGGELEGRPLLGSDDDAVSVKDDCSDEGEGLCTHSSSSLPSEASSCEEQGSNIVLNEDESQPETSAEINSSHIMSASVLTASVANANSLMRRLAASVYVVRATLVEDDQPDADRVEAAGEVYMAEHVRFWDRKAKRLACAICALVALLVVSLSLTLTGVIDVRGRADEATAQPSPSPTFDPRPTLEAVQERGFVRCGFDDITLKKGGGGKVDLCRSVAAVVVGNPDNFEGVAVTGSNRWNVLQNRDIDVLIYGDTHSVEREVRERSSGLGFAFSSPYNYDGLIYSGNSTLVKCAEDYKRYDECSSLSMCVQNASTHYEFLRTSFPSEYFKVASTYVEMLDMLFNDTCNVVAEDKGFLLGDLPLMSAFKDRGFVTGEKMMTKEPSAMVTRNTDREWSDAVNWVLQALIYGEEQGLTRDSPRCQIGTNLDLQSASDLDFMNAVHCVGNYGEQHGPKDRGMNQINNGTGIVFAIPFGDLDQDEITDLTSDSMLAKVMNKGSFNCGVVVPDGFAGNIMESDGIVGLSVDYCRTLSAALFTGDSNNMNFITLQEAKDSPYADLANGTIDVLVGGKLQRKYDFGLPPLFRGLQYSTSYYFGDEAATDDVSFYSMATRQEDVLFDSFVNMVVLATIFADENGITKEESRRMPLVSIFGPKLYWSLRDAISYSGSYDKLYRKHFGSVFQSGYIEQFSEEESRITRGRNILNKGDPMMLSFPQLP